MSMQNRVLLLDAAWRIDRVITTDFACEMLVTDRAVAASDEIASVYRSPSITVEIPAVVARIGATASLRRSRVPACNRRRILDRDAHLCQWVTDGRPCTRHGDSVEHLLPQSRGGTVTWLNSVAACRAHNGFKAARTLDEMRAGYGWSLRRDPFTPTMEQVLRNSLRDVPVPWEPFLAA